MAFARIAARFVGSYRSARPPHSGEAAKRALGALLILPLLAADALPLAVAQAVAQEQKPQSSAQQPAKPPTEAPAAEAVPSRPPPEIEALVAPVNDADTAMDAAERAVERVKDNEDALAAHRRETARIAANAEAAADDIRPRLDAVEAQIQKLGAPPAAEAPSESAAVAAERARLNALASELSGAVKTAELVEERANQLIRRVQFLRQARFAAVVLERTPYPPLEPDLWQQVAAELPGALRQIASIAGDWWAAALVQPILLLLVIAAALAAYFGLRGIRRRFARARLGAGGRDPASIFERAAVASLLLPAIAGPPLAALLVLFLGFEALGLLTPQVRPPAMSLAVSLAIYIAVSAVARVVLQPGRPRWRLLDVSDGTARRLRLIASSIAAVYALDLLLGSIIKWLYLPVQVAVAVAFLTSVAFAALLFALAQTPFAPRTLALETGAQAREREPRWLKLPLSILSLAVAAAALTGYVALARFMAGQIVTTGSILVVAVLLHLGTRGFTRETGEDIPASTFVGKRFGLPATQFRLVSGALAVLLNVLIVLVAIPAALMTWGFSSADIAAWGRAALFGFEIGDMRISLLRLAFAVLVFAAVLIATRFVQRWLIANALKPPRVEASIAQSISTVAGYSGFALALAAAVASAGFDLSSLAIVAGALSVGIGFGLQSIVGNFVSGLILLVERPIKVGDWIVVDGKEGHVRRIAVRATEIETAERASLIVPNSTLIGGTVTNWTHRNALARLSIKVSVHYRSDPNEIRAILDEVARRSTAILEHPPPAVTLDALGSNALEFSLRAYVADVNRAQAVESELRTAILEALRAAGVQVPYPPHEGHLETERAQPVAKVHIGVATDSDPEAVRAILATAVRDIVGRDRRKPPAVYFEAVDTTALDFAVETAVAEGADRRAVESSLRAAVVKALRAAAIELAHPRADVRLRDLDPVRAVLTRVAEERLKSAGPDDLAHAPIKSSGRSG